jgi:hypothetical protein
MSSQEWIDWTPIEGSFGEWALASISWNYKQVGVDTEPYLVIQLENRFLAKQMSLEFITSHYRVTDEHFVANEPGYKSYQRHSLYTIKNSIFVDSYYDNPYWLIPRYFNETGPKLTFKSNYCHYRIITIPDVVDVIGVFIDAKVQIL